MHSIPSIAVPGVRGGRTAAASPSREPRGQRHHSPDGSSPQSAPLRASVAPILPLVKLGHSIGPHQPDEMVMRVTRQQQAHSVDGVARARLRFEIADPDRGCGGPGGGPRRGALDKAPCPAAGLSGLPGDTSHHTSSRPSARIAARLKRRWPRWAGLKLPPRRPMRLVIARWLASPLGLRHCAGIWWDEGARWASLMVSARL